MNYPETVKATFERVLSEMASDPTSFVNNPDKDFSRNRKLSFEDTLKLIISMEGNSLNLEMLNFFQFSSKSPSVSVFLQQRNKLNSSALETVFQKFNSSIPCKGTFKGYRLLACDGSDLNFARNPEDEENYYDPGHSAKGFNIMHLNALYDLCDRRYVDALIQSGHGKDEFRALCSMVERYTAPVDHKSIFIADRGYSSYNVFAHIIEKNEYFLIRTKDKGRKGMVGGLNLPETEEFDITVNLTLIRRQTNATKENLNCRFISKDVSFDFIEYGSDDTYSISFRVVRFALSDDSYECIVTNLSAQEFSPDEIKKLYRRRWNIETSFRELKYAIGLTHFHSKKPKFIQQEVWARLILYNFCEIITNAVVIQKAATKHTYQVNFTMAIHICRYFLRLAETIVPPDVYALICKHILPIRDDRKSPRPHKVNFRKPISFLYRVA